MKHNFGLAKLLFVIRKTLSFDGGFVKLQFVILITLFFLTFFSVVHGFSKVRIPTKQHPTEFYANHLQDDLRLTFKEAMLKAKKSIYLIIYSLTDNQLISILRNKANEGVDITIICDSEASKSCLQKLGDKIKVVSRKPKGIMHMKILVIDEVRAWIGSANMTTESLRFHGNLVLGFYHPKLCQFLIQKAGNMDEEFPCQNFQAGAQKIEFWTLPNEEEAPLKVKKMIDQAKKTIRVAMFTWTRNDFADALISAQKRGVDVRVVMDRYSGKGANRYVLEKLAKAKIPVSLSQGSALLHYKMMVIDNQILINGSANWTKSAFCNNDDCFLILEKLDRSQKKMIQNLWEVIQEDSTPANAA